MIIVKSMRHIATAKTIPGLRSCPSLGRLSSLALDRGRQCQAQGQRQFHEQLRQWRNQQWFYRSPS